MEEMTELNDDVETWRVFSQQGPGNHNKETGGHNKVLVVFKLCAWV